MEGPPKTRKKRREKDVCDECHDRDIHIRGIEIVAWREEVVAVGCLVLSTGGGWALLARPWFVTPGEEDEEEFAEDVRGCNVEVVL